MSARAETFAPFYADMRERAARYAATVLGARRLDSLEDVLQDAWARAWRAWDQADSERRAAWFLRIVRNCAIDQHRRHHTVEPLPATEVLDATVAGLEEATVARVDATRTFALLGSLPPALREVLWLREVLDLTYAEIAEVQGVPIGTVMSRLHAARRRAASLLVQPGACT